MNEIDLFAAAIAIHDPIERAAFLDRYCAGHSELRQRISQLLDAHVQSIAMLYQPNPNPIQEQAALKNLTMEFPAKGERAGKVIHGKYTLVEVIGEGGMGSVWRAKQSEPVKRFVAVKLIKAGMDSKQVLARFDAERQALALMDHPNIAKVLDGGLHEHRPFFVMELVKGVPITEYCDHCKLTPQLRLELFVQVCHAIQHAHQKGIIHRDIKPSNVLIAPYDDKPVVKVIDFGVAKATGGTLTEQTVDTGFGAVVGTPQYMSPEQATLNNIDVDTRSDVYSLGILLYELLTGSPPFARKELEKKGLIEMLRVVREEEPPRPSTKLSTADALPSISANRGTEPKKLTGLLRNELDWIVMKSLDKDRTRRYETANGFAADVLRYLRGEAVQAHPPSTAYILRKFVRRNKGHVIAACIVLFVLLAGMAGTTLGFIRAEQQRQLAERNERRSAEAAIAEREAKVEAEREREQAVLQRSRAVSNEQKAEKAEQRATEQATSAQLLAHYTNAQFMLSQGRLAPAFDAIRSAIQIRPRWEYGNVLREIITNARKDWHPVARFDSVPLPTLASTFVGPSNHVFAFINGSRLHLFDVPNSKMLSEFELGIDSCLPMRIGEQYIGVVHPGSVKIFSVKDLSQPRNLTVSGQIKLVVADPFGSVLAVLFESGETTLYDFGSLKQLAKMQFRLPSSAQGLDFVPSLSFSRDGKRLLFTSGLWTDPSTIWNWTEGSTLKHRFSGVTNSAQFLDEHTIVDVSRWNSALEAFDIGLTDVNNLNKPTNYASFRSRAGNNPISWRDFFSDGSSRILTASTSADSIDLFSLTDRSMINSTRFGSLLPDSSGRPRFLAFSPDSSLLAVAGDQAVTIFQAGPSPSIDTNSTSVGMRFWSLATSHDYFFTADNIGKLRVRQQSFVENQTKYYACEWPKANPGSAAHVWGISATPDGKTLAVLWQENSGGGTIGSDYYRKAILIYRLDSKLNEQGRLEPEQTIWLDHYHGINGRNNRLMVLAPDSQTVAFVVASGDATIYRVKDGSVLTRFQAGTTFRSSPDGSLLFGGSHLEDRPVTFWQLNTGEQISSTPVRGKVRTFAISRDNRKLYVGWASEILECFDLETRQSISKIGSKISPIAIAPEGDRFVGFLPDSDTHGSLVLGSLADGQTIEVLNSGAHILNAASFSPSGECIAFAKSRDIAVMQSSLSIDQSIKLLNQMTGFVTPSPTLTYFKLNEQIQSLAASGDKAAVLRLLPEWLKVARSALADNDVILASTLASLAHSLQLTQAFAEVEPLLRECLTISEKTQPDVWITFNIQSMLGGVLLGQKNYGEAEPLLLKGYEGMKQRENTITSQDSLSIPEALDRLIELYTATEKVDEVKKWQLRRTEHTKSKPAE